MPSVEASVLEKVRIKEPEMWTVVLHNDDFTPMEFVILVLAQVFHLGLEEAEAITMAVHHQGKCPVGRFTKEIAHMKASDVVELAEKFQHPLLAIAEVV